MKLKEKQLYNDKSINVLVTGVGAIIGYGIIKSLRVCRFKVNIVGMDIYEDAVGKNWCDKFVQAKYAVDPTYISFLKKLIDDNEIDLVFFGTEQEIYRCAEAKEELGDYYSKLVINRRQILKLSKDKWKTREYLIENDLENYAIPSVITGTYREISEKFGPKFILKPRSSYASKGIHIVEDEEEFNFYKSKMGLNFMAQQLVGDKESEYTVGAFGLGDGTVSGMIILKRKLSQEGATAKAEVTENRLIEDAVMDITRKLNPIGPTNFQFRLEQEKAYLLEINPRISSSTSIRTAFSYNEAEMCIQWFLGNDINQPIVKKGRAFRFIDEVIVLDE